MANALPITAAQPAAAARAAPPPDKAGTNAQIGAIQNFTSTLASALTAGAGALTDADPRAEAASLGALRDRQSRPNPPETQPQSLLSLFKPG
jgi:hypothetical protein